MNFESTYIDGLYLAKRCIKEDERGSFGRVYCEESFRPILKGLKITQINHTQTNNEGIIRGLHFQYPPSDELKIITCLKGSAYDVVVDIRKKSKTFLKKYTIVLTEGGATSVIVPSGFAHGFQALSPKTEMLYLHTAEHDPRLEGGLNAIDPCLNINWPLPITLRSDRDLGLPLITPSSFKGVD